MKAAFEDDASGLMSEKNPTTKNKQTIIIKKLKERHIAEQLLTIPEVLAIPHTRHEHGGEGGLVIRELIKLHERNQRMDEFEYERMALPAHNTDCHRIEGSCQLF